MENGERGEGSVEGDRRINERKEGGGGVTGKIREKGRRRRCRLAGEGDSGLPDGSGQNCHVILGLHDGFDQKPSCKPKDYMTLHSGFG
ncbi:hypothetical protein TIFTF001_021644 [Ficus carica]|uniref:Uncharacterized protein n=1 Tax=Ficus carica TaxID=3494 RepID=A0AA88AID0_FICCA|nr:hypothetical protein TIFTF001_021644 [Ficus carica]